jgi:hypothetical protein
VSATFSRDLASTRRLPSDGNDSLHQLTGACPGRASVRPASSKSVIGRRRPPSVKEDVELAALAFFALFFAVVAAASLRDWAADGEVTDDLAGPDRGLARTDYGWQFAIPTARVGNGTSIRAMVGPRP